MHDRAPSNPAQRPGRVVGIDGIVFQCDADDALSSLLIRPIQELSLRFRGRSRRAGSGGVPLANHAGIRVRIAGADGRVQPYVVEQLNGTLVQNVANALSWTPWRDFKRREGRGGWDVTVPATAFAGVAPADVLAAIEALNREPGRPFYRELCTAFIERIFGGRPLFDDVEVLDWLVPGPGPRIRVGQHACCSGAWPSSAASGPCAVSADRWLLVAVSGDRGELIVTRRTAAFLASRTPCPACGRCCMWHFASDYSKLARG